MSLKIVHIFLITVSIVLSFVFGAWGLREGGMLNRSMGIGALAAGIFLIFYLVWFIRKAGRDLT